ncbi:hypothetical protein SAMN04488009_2695 [Maribacter sedimenticola]|uniref:3-oxoacyl-ACP synthase n=1 Tax=Maribacter sedimenticola TaxID=228956 RepID=A0ABY1SJ07_9FLAO|nr:hypothetical protein [Maribacter sedimenticola]SNR59255.1 hypothetical protein SAMN04488009_2695 [Maribacter sedimenticola]
MKKTNDFQELKDNAYQFCGQFVADKFDKIHLQITELETALTTETKSSAGDKHETGRAMIQLEREKLGQRLAELEKTKQVLSKIPRDSGITNIGLGNLVVTDAALYYIGISAGVYKQGTSLVYCISAGTPIGQLLFRKSVGEHFSFNGKTITILTIH